MHLLKSNVFDLQKKQRDSLFPAVPIALFFSKLVVIDYGDFLVNCLTDISLYSVCQRQLAHWTACAGSDKLYVNILVLGVIADILDITTIILESMPNSVDRLLDSLFV